MTIRDAMWALGGFFTCSALLVFTFWWHATKSGVKSIEVPTALTKTMKQVERVAETHQQLKENEDIREAAFIKHWSAVEKQLKALQLELNKTNQALEQHKKEHAVMVASKPAPQHSPTAEFVNGKLRVDCS